MEGGVFHCGTVACLREAFSEESTDMDFDLRHRVALVAASSSGLGRACASALAAEGARVVVSSRSLERAQAAADEIAQRTKSETAAFACDLSQPGEPQRLVEQCVARFGQLDVLVTNAGGPPAGGFADFDDATWQQAIQLTLLSVVRLIRASLPHLRASKRGRIINLSSTSVKEPIDHLLLSNSIRPGVIGLARTLARDLAPFGITVNNVCPGRIRTPRLTTLYGSADALAQAAEQIPMGRLGEPEDFSPIVAFLAGAQAGYITGQTICVDGGLTRSLM
jgi:3-oxoacyl-[acyl-carrier protein] reductase